MGNDYKYTIESNGYVGILKNIDYCDFGSNFELAVMAVEDYEKGGNPPLKYPVIVYIINDHGDEYPESIKFVGRYKVCDKLMPYVEESYDPETGLWRKV